jgi:phosphate uptake regulator
VFKEIIESEKRTSLLYDALQEGFKMMKEGERMFTASCDSLVSGEPPELDLARSDRDINASDRLVRRMIFQHLMLNPRQDLPASLGLITVIHDMERIGDYAKSLLELRGAGMVFQEGSADTEGFCSLREMISPLFAKTCTALVDSDAEMAREVMAVHEQVKIRVDVLTDSASEAIQKGQMTPLFPLAVRFLRRVSAHLSNVASSVVNPLDQIASKATNE